MQEKIDEISKLSKYKKLDALLALGNDEKNIPVLMHFAENERGNVKDYALRALATFDVPEALPLYKKMLKSKSKGEGAILYGTTDGISDLVAEEAHKFFDKLFQHEEGYHFSPEEFRKVEFYAYKPEEFEEFQKYLSLLLGKASEKMQDLYRLFAENMDKFVSFGFKWMVNEHFNFHSGSNLSRGNKMKIFPHTLALSIVRNPDERLITLANELSEKYGKNWLTAKMVGSFFTEKASDLFEKYSPLLHTKDKTYVLDALALIYFKKNKEKHTAVAQWGDYYDDRNDTRTYFTRELLENLDERWLEVLTEIEAEKIPLQAYFSMNAGVAVYYNAYDQMLQALLPKNIENKVIKDKLVAYFLEREKAEKGASLYIDALNWLNVPITEAMIEKWIGYKPEAVSKYNVPVMLNHNTQWTPQQKLDFYKKLPANMIEESAVKEWKKEIKGTNK